MLSLLLLKLLFIAINVVVSLSITQKTDSDIPLVYFYKMTKGYSSCNIQMPTYLVYSLAQALLVRKTSGGVYPVIFMANLRECIGYNNTFAKHPELFELGLKLIDTTSIVSERTKFAEKISTRAMIEVLRMYEPLYHTALARFFYLEDFMRSYGYKSLLHMESDNPIFVSLDSLLINLRKSVIGFSVTPLTDNDCMSTASAVWIPTIEDLIDFNNNVTELFYQVQHGGRQYDEVNVSQLPLEVGNRVNNFSLRDSFISSMRHCSKTGPYFVGGKRNKGILPHTFNEMSFLAYYHLKHRSTTSYLPVLPDVPYRKNRYVRHCRDYAVNGRRVRNTAEAVWDVGSWGQFVGGTNKKHGTDKGYHEGGHVVGKAIGLTGCNVKHLCNTYKRLYNRGLGSNQAALLPSKIISNKSDINYLGKEICWTQPYARCGDLARSNLTEEDFESGKYNWTSAIQWWPLVNLHMHAKDTRSVMSKPCSCYTGEELKVDKWYDYLL